MEKPRIIDPLRAQQLARQIECVKLLNALIGEMQFRGMTPLEIAGVFETVKHSIMSKIVSVNPQT